MEVSAHHSYTHASHLVKINLMMLSAPPHHHHHNKVTAEELSGNDDYVELSFSARKLDDKVCVTVCAL